MAEQATKKASTFELPEVAFVSGFGYIVRSASNPSTYRLVYENNQCTCPAAEHGAKTCRHRRAVHEFCERRAAEYKRPIAPPHISALVD